MGVQSRPRKPRAFGEERTPRVDIFDPADRAAIKRQIEQGDCHRCQQAGTGAAAETVDYEKQERRQKRLEWEIRALRTLAGELGLWQRL